MHLRQKTTFFLQKTISLSPVSHNHLILIPFVAFTNSDEIPFFPLHNSQLTTTEKLQSIETPFLPVLRGVLG